MHTLHIGEHSSMKHAFSDRKIALLAGLALLVVAALLAAALLFVLPKLSVSPTETQTDILEGVYDKPAVEENLAPEDSNPEAEKAKRSHLVICIDPGHSERPDATQIPIGPGSAKTRPIEPGGTSGVATGVPEYKVVLDVGLKLKKLLQDEGFQVVMVREDHKGSIGSDKRAQIANDAHANLFVRLHCDGAPNSATSGFLTLIPAQNSWTSGMYEESSRAGNFMHKAIIEKLGVNNRGISERGDLAGFNWSKVPSVLFEMGCMTNPEEDKKLVSDEYQNELASAMAAAITTYFDSKQS